MGDKAKSMYQKLKEHGGSAYKQFKELTKTKEGETPWWKKLTGGSKDKKTEEGGEAKTPWWKKLMGSSKDKDKSEGEKSSSSSNWLSKLSSVMSSKSSSSSSSNSYSRSSSSSSSSSSSLPCCRRKADGTFDKRYKNCRKTGC